MKSFIAAVLAAAALAGSASAYTSRGAPEMPPDTATLTYFDAGGKRVSAIVSAGTTEEQMKTHGDGVIATTRKLKEIGADAAALKAYVSAQYQALIDIETRKIPDYLQTDGSVPTASQFSDLDAYISAVNKHAARSATAARGAASLQSTRQALRDAVGLLECAVIRCEP